MTPTVRHPTDRTCERCGREEQWDDDASTWQVIDDNAGSVYCIHEWDINGSFAPFDDNR